MISIAPYGTPTSDQKNAMKAVFGRDATQHEQDCFMRLRMYLNRDPSASEIGNMATDSNLQAWVLTGQ